MADDFAFIIETPGGNLPPDNAFILGRQRMAHTGAISIYCQ
jgi:hypothetical protein